MRLASLIIVFATVTHSQSSDVRMNQVQVTGSHNSYKQAIDPELFAYLRGQAGKKMDGLDYAHRPIPEQLDLGLRALEIDVVYDPQGGLYAHPAGLSIEQQNHLHGAPYDPEHLMTRPGLKVLHVPDIDFRANVYTFGQELKLLKDWSVEHPGHLPITVTMNAKDDGVKRPGFVTPLKFDAAAFGAWDAEILAGIGRDKLIVPDDVRGSHPTLESAVLAHDWPKLDAVRGKFMFVLDEEDPKRTIYCQGHPSLRNRVMFVNAPEGAPEAAFRIVNEPGRDWAYIQYLVRTGYFVRTRADADTVEARKNDLSRQRAALLSGAQIISTDYYLPDTRINATYKFFRAPTWDSLLLPAQRPLDPLRP